MTESESNSESRVKAVLNDDLLASLVLVSNAAAEMADRLKMLMEMHAIVAPITGQHLGNRGLEDWGRAAHWWMENLGNYFNATDAVDDEDPRDQSWDLAFDAARKFFPLANDPHQATASDKLS